MHLVILQLMSSITATGMITFVVTHLHADLITWSLWLMHWSLAVPIAFVTTRWITPCYKRVLQL